MAKTVSTTIEIKDDASASLGKIDKASDSLRSQMRLLREQMAQMLVDGIEPMSAEFQELAQRAGALQDAMGDANAIMGDFASDTHNIDKYTSSVETLVAGYGLIQSAASMLGVENENLEKNMQNLMAAQTALNSVQKISNQLQDQSTGLYKLLHYQVVTYTGASKAAAIATKALNIALKSIGIGLVISAVALLSEHWEDLVNWFKKTIPSATSLIQPFNKIKAVLMGIGNAVIQFVITPIQGLIKVINDLKDGEYKQALNDIKDTFKKQLNNVSNIVDNFETGYTNELQYQEEKRTKKVEEEIKKRVDAYKEGAKKIKEANETVNQALSDDIVEDYKKELEKKKKATKEELDYEAEIAKKKAGGIQEDEEETEENKEVEKYLAKSQKLKEVAANSKVASQTISEVGECFSIVGDAVDGAAGSMIAWAGNTMSSIAQVIPQIVSLIAAKEGEAVAGATASGSSLPFPANIAAIATGLASVFAAFIKIPKFADGGIAYGPTLGIFGEYSGASNNPEVVAPLDKLQSMINPAESSFGGQVEFKIKGRELVGILGKETSIRDRS